MTWCGRRTVGRICWRDRWFIGCECLANMKNVITLPGIHIISEIAPFIESLGTIHSAHIILRLCRCHEFDAVVAVYGVIDSQWTE